MYPQLNGLFNPQWAPQMMGPQGRSPVTGMPTQQQRMQQNWLPQQQPQPYGMADYVRFMLTRPGQQQLSPALQAMLAQRKPNQGNLQALNRTPNGISPAMWSMLQQRFPNMQQNSPGLFNYLQQGMRQY